ncbi:MAG TPA: hypothetical protein VFE58_11720 [Tepidisphaeraceae bacterium]|nr:hypothetical protein [Tepidisphaeraceae bacterium]
MIDDIDVFQHKWRSAGLSDAHVHDPQYDQPFIFSACEIVSGDKRVVFAAGEFSNNVWGFHGQRGI